MQNCIKICKISYLKCKTLINEWHCIEVAKVPYCEVCYADKRQT